MADKTKRNGFASGIGFVLSAAGAAVGLGNLWSFPYKTSANGGSAFVIVYILSVIVLGSIVMVAEICLGKRSQANLVTSFKKTNKNLGWVGLLSICIPCIIIFYYSVLGGYTVKFTMNSFSDNSTVLGEFSGNVGEVILYTAIFLILAVIIISAGVKGGIERASKVLMPVLFIVLVAIVIYCLCLGEGVSDGLNYYLKPDFEGLGFDGVLAAMSQSFYSLSLGMGITVAYGSYSGQTVKVGKSVLLICFCDTMVAFLAGLAIFPAIYHYKAIGGTIPSEKGVVLLFSSLPMVFSSLGAVGKIVSFLFYGMVVIAALTSVIALLEVITQFVIQMFMVKRKNATMIIAGLCFAVSIPIGISLGFAINDSTNMQIFGQNWLDFFDIVTNTVLMPVCALFACIAIGWFIDKKFTFNPMNTLRTLKEDGFNLGFLGKTFSVMVKYVTPVLILVIEIFGVKDLIFPDGVFNSNGLGIVITAYAILIVVIAVYFVFLKNKDAGCNADELKDKVKKA